MKILLLKNHRHAGKNYSAGESIDVKLDTANYLANIKVATPLSGIKVESQEQSTLFRGRGRPIEASTEVAKSVEVIPPVDTSVDHAGSK